jgi:all-trans-retinol 13,14-reductase
LRGYFASSVPPRPLTRLAHRFLVPKAHEAATITTDEMMSRYLRDERLKDVLDAQWGNIGMPRPRCSFLVHAAMLGYYLESPPTYPMGGSSAFARYLGQAIERQGSAIRLKVRVEKILVEKNRAVGVVLTNGEELRAKRVVSSAGAVNTYTKLLEPHPKIQPIADRVRRLPLAYEYMNLFFGLDTSPKLFGLGAENHWIHHSWNTGRDVFWDIENLETCKEPKIIFLNFSSLKDPEFGRHGHAGYSGQVVFIGKQGVFAPWNDTRFRRRGADYEALKRRTGDALIASLDRHFPGLARHVVHQELSTKLTYEHFSAHPGGVPYGIAAIPERYLGLDMRPATPIRNLFLCGQDMVMPGVSAAFGSAMMVTSLIRRRDMGGFLRERGKKVLGL